MLEGDGFVARGVYPEIPLRVEDSLTPVGRETTERRRERTDGIEKSLLRVLGVLGARAAR